MQGPQCLREGIPDRAFGDCCDVHRMIIIHLDHSIRNMEKSSGASGNQDSGDPCLFIEIPGTFRNGVMGSFSRQITRCMKESRTIKLVAEVSSSRRKTLLPASILSTIPAACEVLPLASSVEKQRVSFYLEDR